jgi:hypothetical protein
MLKDTIAEIGIDDAGRLYVRPASRSFEHVYRAAMEVYWDASNGWLFSPKPREWTYVDGFKQIVAAAADEYGTALNVTSDTAWSNVPTSLQAQIESLARS